MASVLHSEPDTHIPAPWELTGSGLIIPFILNKDFKHQHFPDWHGRLAIMMFVNYLSSPVGPYREWMLIPGKLDNPLGRHFSIHQIFVDSQQSMVGGQKNWGIPKELASFTFDQESPNWQLGAEVEDGSVQVQGQLKGPSFPIHSALMPFSLYQERQGTHFWTRPKAIGWGRLMKIQNMNVQGSRFIDFGEQTCFGALAITEFNMQFPVAKTRHQE